MFSCPTSIATKHKFDTGQDYLVSMQTSVFIYNCTLQTLKTLAKRLEKNYTTSPVHYWALLTLFGPYLLTQKLREWERECLVVIKWDLPKSTCIGLILNWKRCYKTCNFSEVHLCGELLYDVILFPIIYWDTLLCFTIWLETSWKKKLK